MAKIDFHSFDRANFMWELILSDDADAIRRLARQPQPCVDLR